MHASLVPTASDLAAMLAYLLGNPFLFISSSTVMTTGIVAGVGAVSVFPRSAPIIRSIAPSLAMVLAYFGVGSMALATEILLRFHYAIPDATETQFTSGVGHLLAAGLGIAVLLPHLRRRSRHAWIIGNAVAVAYWMAQIAFLTPPWFAFAGQLELVRGFAFAALAVGALVSVALWRAAPPRR